MRKDIIRASSEVQSEFDAPSGALTTGRQNIVTFESLDQTLRVVLECGLYCVEFRSRGRWARCAASLPSADKACARLATMGPAPCPPAQRRLCGF